MRGERARWFGVIPFILALFLIVQETTADAGTVYRFGVVPQFEPRKLFDIWQPILDELEQRTGLMFRMEGSPKIPDFELAFMTGAFDFAYMNPYHAMLAAEEQGYEPLVRDGGRSLRGVLVVRKDSPIREVTELEGREVAFPAPNALGASLLTRADLASMYGVTVKPFYVQTHSSVYLHVHLGLAAAGGGVASTLARQAPEIRNDLRVLYRTRPMSPHPVTAHPRVPKEDRELVRRAFLDMGKTEAGAAILAKVPIAKVVAASVGDYVELRNWGLESFYVWPE
jgi:phosphonate transport system substrate-binding protein